MKEVVGKLVARRLDDNAAETLAEELAGGHYTHDDPITLEEARRMKLPVEEGLPKEIYELMGLFPQGGRRPRACSTCRSPAPPMRRGGGSGSPP